MEYLIYNDGIATTVLVVVTRDNDGCDHNGNCGKAEFAVQIQVFGEILIHTVHLNLLLVVLSLRGVLRLDRLAHHVKRPTALKLDVAVVIALLSVQASKKIVLLQIPSMNFTPIARSYQTLQTSEAA